MPNITKDGVTYEVLRRAKVMGFKQDGGIIVAKQNGKDIWALIVYPIVFDKNEEHDVQENYINKMTFSRDGKSILINSEHRKSYKVNIDDRSVVEIPYVIDQTFGDVVRKYLPWK